MPKFKDRFGSVVNVDDELAKKLAGMNDYEPLDSAAKNAAKSSDNDKK